MTTHFITAEIDLQENPRQLKQEIEARLKKEGEPLRWAVTKIDKERQKAEIEAIVTARTRSSQAPTLNAGVPMTQDSSS